MIAKKKFVVFVVEDNKTYNFLVSEYLQKKIDVEIKSFFNGKDCVKAISNGERPDIIIQDYFLDDLNGIEVLQKVQKINPDSEFIFLTANESMEVAVNTIKFGAYDYIIKDKLALDKVVNKIHRIIKIKELEKWNKQIKKAIVFFLIFVFIVVVVAFLHFVLNVFGLN